MTDRIDVEELVERLREKARREAEADRWVTDARKGPNYSSMKPEHSDCWKAADALLSQARLLQEQTRERDEAREEVLYWRRNVAAHLRTGVILARAAQQRGDQAEAVRIAVMSINPMVAALDNALSGNVHYPLCEHCGRPVKPGDAVIHYEDGEVAHLDCDNPQSPDPLPPEATRHEVHEDDTPEGIRKALEDARAFVHEDEPNEGEVGALDEGED